MEGQPLGTVGDSPCVLQAKGGPQAQTASLRSSSCISLRQAVERIEGRVRRVLEGSEMEDPHIWILPSAGLCPLGL